MAREKAGFFYVKTLDGGPPAKDWCRLKGAVPYYEGSILRISATSGSAAKAAANATAIYGVIGANIATSSATATEAPVYLADGNNVFEAKMLATGAPTLRRFDKVAFTVGTTHNYRLAGTAYNGGATGSVRIIDVHPDDASGTAANKRYYVTFTPETSLLGESTNAK